MSEGVRREEYDEYENWYSVDVLKSYVGCGLFFLCFVMDMVWCRVFRFVNRRYLLGVEEVG